MKPSHAEALQGFDQLPDSAFVRLPVVAALHGVSPATVWRWSRAGTLPRPVRRGGVTVWNVGRCGGREVRDQGSDQNRPAEDFDGSTGNRSANADAVLSGHPFRVRHNAPCMVPALLTDEQAAAFFGISVRKFHELRSERAGWMPAPIVLGPRLLRWSRSELEGAVQSMPRQQRASEPAQLLRARIEKLKAGAAV